jgi:hypothetical protein
MTMELEVARAKLAFNAKLAAILRREFGLERMQRGGYRALPRIRVNKMERRRRAPVDVAIRVVRLDKAAATAVVEWEDPQGRIRQCELPQVALVRYARRREALNGR